MTAYEIYDQINHFAEDPETGEAICNILIGLYYDNKESEAVSYIEDSFKCDNKTAKEVFDIFKSVTGEPLSQQQIAHNIAEWEDLLNNKPKCPICQSTNLKKISNWSKSASTLVWGVLAAGRVSKTWHCNNCDSEW